MANIKDVAKLAEVSTASVSRYLNVPEKLKQATRIRIQEAIKILSYRPSIIAQSMRSQSSRYIAMILEDVSNPFYAEILHGAEQCARENNYNIVVINVSKDKKKEKVYYDILFRRGFVGVIYCFSMDESDEKILKTLKRRGVPLVLVDNELFKNKYTCINTDNYKAAYNGTKYLIDKGHKRIALVCFNKFYDQVNLRKKGYIDALLDNSIEYNPSFVYETDLSMDGGMKIAGEVSKEINKYTAIFCISDYVAIGMLKYFNKNNIRIPEDISILGFDDIEWTKIVTPALTTIHQKKKKLGYLSVEKVISFLEKKHNKNLLIELDTFIVERESVRSISNL